MNINEFKLNRTTHAKPSQLPTAGCLLQRELVKNRLGEARKKSHMAEWSMGGSLKQMNLDLKQISATSSMKSIVKVGNLKIWSIKVFYTIYLHCIFISQLNHKKNTGNGW